MKKSGSIVACAVLTLVGTVCAEELPYAASITGPVPRKRMQEVVQKLLDEGEKFDCVITIGPLIMMKFVCLHHLEVYFMN